MNISIQVPTYFSWLLFSCGKFGHKAIECRTYPRNQYNSKRSFKYEPPRSQQNINRFEHLRNNIECYKCQNFGHIARDCRLENSPEESSKPQNERTCKKKKTDECALALKVQNNKDVRYVDNGFSTHMTRDRNKFLSLKEKKDGTVSFRNDGSSNILGSGTVSLG